MPTAQIILSEAERQELDKLSQLEGKTPEALMHEAVLRLLAEHQQEQRLEALRQVRGLWADREDVPALETLRGEWDRV